MGVENLTKIGLYKDRKIKSELQSKRLRTKEFYILKIKIFSIIYIKKSYHTKHLDVFLLDHFSTPLAQVSSVDNVKLYNAHISDPPFYTS